MATPKRPTDNQMLADTKVAHSLRDIVTTMRERYPHDPDLNMAERCLHEFRPSTSFEPQRPSARRGLPLRETLADKAVEK